MGGPAACAEISPGGTGCGTGVRTAVPPCRPWFDLLKMERLHLTRSLPRRIYLRALRPFFGVRARPRIPLRLGVAGFFEELERRKVRYVVLRWFNTLPHVGPEEDVDLLVDDADVSKLLDLLPLGYVGIPCDVYSASGLPGTDYRGVAYYPPQLAEQILANAFKINALCRVPAPSDYFFSLSFHAVYHKGLASGLPTSLPGLKPLRSPDHDYHAVLAELAHRQGIRCDLTLEGLDDFLAAAGWRPSHDALARLMGHNPWIQARFFKNPPTGPAWARGLSVFLIRRVAVERNAVEWLVRLIEQSGFEVLLVKSLTPAERLKAEARIRGGNWRAGPWPVSGGPPALVVVALDLCPRPVPDALRAKHPLLDNGRVHEAKVRVREVFNQSLPAKARCNCIHSSDNAWHALEYLAVVAPEAIESLRRQAEELLCAFKVPYPVLEELPGERRRARVDVVDFNGRRAVCKTFRPGATDFLARELIALEKLAASNPAIPELLERGPNYFVVPYYQDILPRTETRSPAGFIPIEVAQEALNVVRRFWEQGYTLTHFHPRDVIVTEAGIKVVDFEFLQPYNGDKPLRLEDVVELRGDATAAERDSSLEVPTGGGYEALWRPAVGLSIESLMHDPLWLQRTKRIGYRAWRRGRNLINEAVTSLRCLPGCAGSAGGSPFA